jgi:hypothetical protein
MNAISEIKIIGMDTDRLPRVRKEPYIDLFFKLSQKVPDEWCESFNILGRRIKPSPKVDNASKDCIQSYVNDMASIAQHLSDIKKAVQTCNKEYQEKLDAKAKLLAERNSSLQGQDGAQNKLNQIIEALDFDS